MEAKQNKAFVTAQRWWLANDDDSSDPVQSLLNFNKNSIFQFES